MILSVEGFGVKRLRFFFEGVFLKRAPMRLRAYHIGTNYRQLLTVCITDVKSGNDHLLRRLTDLNPLPNGKSCRVELNQFVIRFTGNEQHPKDNCYVVWAPTNRNL